MMEFIFCEPIYGVLFFDEKNNRAPLHLAARKGADSIVKFLLSKNADPNVITVEKDNTLHFAAQTGYVEIGKLLIKYTNLINAQNNDGVCLFLGKSNFLTKLPFILQQRTDQWNFLFFLQKMAAILKPKTKMELYNWLVIGLLYILQRTMTI